MNPLAPRLKHRLELLLVAALATNLTACGGGDVADAADTVAVAAPDTRNSTGSPVLAAVTGLTDNASLSPTPDEELAVLAAYGESAEGNAAATYNPSGDSLPGATTTPTPTPLADTAPTMTIQSITSASTTALVPSGAVAGGDILNQARPALTFGQQSWGNNQCAGYILASQQTPESGLHGGALPDGRTLRFGRVADSSTASGYAYELAVNPSDALTAGSYRCELAFAADADRALPRRTNFWHALAIKLPDWRSTSDEQALAQWHAGDTSGGLLPIYTLLVRGKTMRLVLRYSTSDTPTRGNTKTFVVWSTDQWTPNVWLNVITQAKISTQPSDGPFVKTWINGRQVLNYSGPVGYNQPAAMPYAKQGVYHWVDATNLWDMRIPTRVVRMKRPLLVRESTEPYTLASVSALLDNE